MSLRRSSRIIEILGCLAAATALTAGAYFCDQRAERTRASVEALTWARQVAANAQGIALEAQARDVEDPAAYVANLLNQGVEPRAMRVEKARIESTQIDETFLFDREHGAFEFSKILLPESGTGVKILIPAPYLGFLGARSRPASDALLVLLASGVFSLFFLVLQVRSLSRASRNDARLRHLIAAWIAQAKPLLTEFGVHIRETVREAKNLAQAASRSRSSTEALREKIRVGVNELHESRGSLREAEQTAQKLKTLAVQAQGELARAGSESKELLKILEQMRDLAHRAHQITQNSHAAMSRAEAQIEPWLMEADQAYHSYDDVFRASETMNAQIHGTTESLVEQAKLLQELKSRAAAGGAGRH